MHAANGGSSKDTPSFEHIGNLFQAFDFDHSGSLSETEWRSLYRMISPPASSDVEPWAAPLFGMFCHSPVQPIRLRLLWISFVPNPLYRDNTLYIRDLL